MEIVVDTGNIVDAGADVVVVSANASLRIEGRAGAALVEHGGDRILAALDARARRGGIGVGDVVFTEAGRHARIGTIAWAVIRDYRPDRPDIGDENAVRLATDTLWRTLVDNVRSASPLRIAIVPLAAVELGAERSAALVAASLAAATELHRHLAGVTFITARADDVVALLRGVRSSFPDARFAPPRPPEKPKTPAKTTRSAAPTTPAAALTSSTTPTTATPPPPTPTTTTTPVPTTAQRRAPKEREVGSVVIETFNSCNHAAPVGCGGTLFRVRRRDAPARFVITIQTPSGVDDVAIDGVPVADSAMLVDGDHVFTGRLRAPGRPCVVVHLAGVDSHTCAVGRFSTSEPDDGWRDPDFDDGAWAPLRWSQQAPRGLVPVDPLVIDTAVWVRLRFTTKLGRPQ